jgi:hypothetical protein
MTADAIRRSLLESPVEPLPVRYTPKPTPPAPAPAPLERSARGQAGTGRCEALPGPGRPAGGQAPEALPAGGVRRASTRRRPSSSAPADGLGRPVWASGSGGVSEDQPWVRDAEGDGRRVVPDGDETLPLFGARGAVRPRAAVSLSVSGVVDCVGDARSGSLAAARCSNGTSLLGLLSGRGLDPAGSAQVRWRACRCAESRFSRDV